MPCQQQLLNETFGGCAKLESQKDERVNVTVRGEEVGGWHARLQAVSGNVLPFFPRELSSEP